MSSDPRGSRGGLSHLDPGSSRGQFKRGLIVPNIFSLTSIQRLVADRVQVESATWKEMRRSSLPAANVAPPPIGSTGFIAVGSTMTNLEQPDVSKILSARAYRPSVSSAVVTVRCRTAMGGTVPARSML
jgi:hypothetical protein